MKLFVSVTTAVIIAGSCILLCFLFADFPYPGLSAADLLSQSSGLLKERPGNETYSPAHTPGQKNISSSGTWFIDTTGRVMLLRGVNLGRNSTIPAPALQKKLGAGSATDSLITFTGKPFPINEADAHFRRLKNWGFRFIRYVITWEAIEHQGPGIYDQEYLNYTAAIIKKAGEYGFDVFIDPHEDVWSRATGGDGAPLWTLEKAGFAPQNFWETGAAIDQAHSNEKLPPMTWPTNFNKLGAGTMFTLFFGGNAFAPHLKIAGEPVQEFLQQHYINSVLQVVKKLKGFKNVIGFDTMNEPQQGWIGNEDLNQPMFFSVGPSPTPFESIRLGAGESLTVPYYTIGLRGNHIEKNTVINTRHLSAWQNVSTDIWRNEGVWKSDSPGHAVLLKPGYFSRYHGRKIDFTNDFMKPFIERFALSVHREDPSLMIFSENMAMLARLPRLRTTNIRYVNAPHMYDVLTLTTKKYFSWIDYDALGLRWVLGKHAIRKLFGRVLAQLKNDTGDKLGKSPTLVGEIGIPMDLGNGDAYKSGDFSEQEEAYDRCISAMEGQLMNYTLWNYSPDNTNQQGDNWQGEDLSIFSLSQQINRDDPNSGGRALGAVVRPFPYKVSGIPLKSYFDYRKKVFFLSFRNDRSIHAPTEIFIPAFQYPNGYTVFFTGGRVMKDSDNSLLCYYPNASMSVHTLIIVAAGDKSLAAGKSVF